MLGGKNILLFTYLQEANELMNITPEGIKNHDAD